MRILSVCSPSHEPFRDQWFLPTLPPGFEPEVLDVDQTCASALHRTEGWREAVSPRYGLIADAITRAPDEIMVYSDIDVRFFDLRPETVIAALGDSDLALQRDSYTGRVCSGFFVFRGNARVLALMRSMQEQLAAEASMCDQPLLNDLMEVKRWGGGLRYRLMRWPGLGHRLLDLDFTRRRFESCVRWRYLDASFWTPGHGLRHEEWSPGNPVQIPRRIVIHHANWCLGIEGKLRQLEYVDGIVRARGGAPAQRPPHRPAHKAAHNAAHNSDQR